MILKDTYGRLISYLRISLTEKCNLACGYCYGDSQRSGDSRTRLSDDELIKLIKAFSYLGIDKIRFTGGEPLLRKGIAGLIRKTSAIEPVKIIGLTTNGTLLSPKLDSLINAGLNRLNVSLDSLDKETYLKITGRDCFNAVLDSINLAEQHTVFNHIKINVVMMRGINDGEIPEFAEWALGKKIDLRFIEFMPAYKSGWGEELFIGEDEIKKRVGFELEPILMNESNSGPAKSFRYGNYPGRISFISAVSRGFCWSCNRLRVSSTGDLIGCLFNNSSVNLRTVLRKISSEEEIATAIAGIFKSSLVRKPPDLKIVSGSEPSMREIGG